MFDILHPCTHHPNKGDKKENTSLNHRFWLELRFLGNTRAEVSRKKNYFHTIFFWRNYLQNYRFLFSFRIYHSLPVNSNSVFDLQ